MKTILFQGDSVTDAERVKGDDQATGYGYPTLVKAQLGFEMPGEYTYINRGISGNRVLDLYARIVCDILNVKPDYMSILIGVNDIWHGIDWNNGTGLERYEKVYNMLIEEIKAELPNTKIIILEPFVLEGSATKSTDEQPGRYDAFRNGLDSVAKAARRVAEKHNLKFVELQRVFDEACTLAEPGYWLKDGVHPTAMGHELIKREWIKAFNEIR